MNETWRGFSASVFSPSLLNWVVDGLNWSIEDGRMRLCDTSVFGNDPVKWMNKSWHQFSSVTGRKAPVSKCLAGVWPQESRGDERELLTFTFSVSASLSLRVGVLRRLSVILGSLSRGAFNREEEEEEEDY
ncbi:unnamed protein product [Leuciscus chuanchicus]